MVNGQEVWLKPDEVTNLYLFLGEVLGLAWAGEDGPLDKKPGESPPTALFPEMSHWRAIREKSQGRDASKMDKAELKASFALKLLYLVKNEWEAANHQLNSHDVADVLVNILTIHVVAHRKPELTKAECLASFFHAVCREFDACWCMILKREAERSPGG